MSLCTSKIMNMTFDLLPMLLLTYLIFFMLFDILDILINRRLNLDYYFCYSLNRS